MSEKNLMDYSDFQDISSSSQSNEKVEVKEYIEKYGNGLFKHMGGIIKFIAFLICFAIIIASLVAAYIFLSKTTFSIILSIAIVGGGSAVALIFLFMIYGMGHIISQNNKILTRLNQLINK